MVKKQMMKQAAQRALEAVLGLQSGERVLVITDGPKESVGRAFLEAAAAIGAFAAIYLLPQEQRPLLANPPGLLAALEGRDVVINAFSGMPEETRFRVALIKTEMSIASRVGHCPGITDEMMTEGPMNVDYASMVEQSRRVMAALGGARSAHVTAPGGSDLRVFIEDRAFQTDVLIAPGTWGNLPAGEIWCGPEETKGEGTVVCDGSIGDLGQVPSPLSIRIKAGRIEEIRCEDRAFEARVRDLCSVDSEAAVIGELGIGLNPGARITGNLLEDEKAFQTIHIAFGNNVEMPGGQNTSATHRDFLVRRPTMVVSFTDGSERVLIRNGDILV